jgi:GNAT superfamily N-acetyltransferase
VTWRSATPDDAAALRDLERDANLIGLAHVFPGLPFPDEGVLARWRSTLADPSVSTEVLVDAADTTLIAFSAYDATGRLRHLAVRPDRWGCGLGRAAIDRTVQAIRAAGHSPMLWVLVANDRARALYERLGWERTGREQPAEWPPYPTEIEYRLPESAHGQ